MRALPILLALAAGGCRVADCKDGTLFVNLTFDAATAQADHLGISVVVPGGATQTGTSARGPMGSSGSLEIDFGGGYPSGKSVTVTVTAFQGAAIVGMGSTSTTLSNKCARLTLAVSANGMSGDDMAMPPSGDLAGTGPDFAATPDMSSCIPSSGSVTQWVDPALGSDDAAHGAQPGACAYKTITYALAHATGRINLANVMYTPSASELFPLVLNGAQILDCDPNNTGTKAKLVGTGDYTSVAGTIVIRGTANQILKCDISSPSGTSTQGIACIQVLTTGAHVIDSSNLHSCAMSNTIGISGLVSTGNSGGVTMLNTTIGTGITNCLNQIGTNWTIWNLTCTASNDGINACGAGLAGCGNTISATTPLNGCSGPTGFQAPCAANTDMAH